MISIVNYNRIYFILVVCFFGIKFITATNKRKDNFTNKKGDFEGNTKICEVPDSSCGKIIVQKLKILQ